MLEAQSSTRHPALKAEHHRPLDHLHPQLRASGATELGGWHWAVGHRQRPGVAAWRPSPRTLAGVVVVNAPPVETTLGFVLHFCFRSSGSLDDFCPSKSPAFPRGLGGVHQRKTKFVYPTNPWAAPFDRIQPSQKGPSERCIRSVIDHEITTRRAVAAVQLLTCFLSFTCGSAVAHVLLVLHVWLVRHILHVWLVDPSAADAAPSRYPHVRGRKCYASYC
jgi:hypothetical protein